MQGARGQLFSRPTRPPHQRVRVLTRSVRNSPAQAPHCDALSDKPELVDLSKLGPSLGDHEV